MTIPATRGTIDAVWADYLGCDRAALHGERITALPHHDKLAGYRGAFLLRHDAGCVVSAPPHWLDAVARTIRGRATGEVFDPRFLAGLFGDATERIVGPAWLGYADATGFRPAQTLGARLLDGDDRAALERLARECDPTEWEHSGIDLDAASVFGLSVDGALVAAGICEPWGDHILHVGIVTHPAQRGRGYGRAVVSAMSMHGLARGRIMQYRTLQANLPSMSIARALGYRHYASTLAVRLTE